MESQIFKIEMSGKCWCSKNIENCLQTHHRGKVKVTNISINPQPTEWCNNKNHIGSATEWLPDKNTYLCSFCQKPIKINKESNERP